MTPQIVSPAPTSLRTYPTIGPGNGLFSSSAGSAAEQWGLLTISRLGKGRKQHGSDDSGRYRTETRPRCSPPSRWNSCVRDFSARSSLA